jgi:uncharacterized protein
VLSAEIIAITLGTVATQPLLTQFSVLAGIAVIMTIGVYGIVAGIVKLDDLGLYLSLRPGRFAHARRAVGRGILLAAPYLMKFLSVAGTAAMFLVGGGILTHGLPAVHHRLEAISAPLISPLPIIVPALLDGLFGMLAGAVVLAVVTGIKRLLPSRD